VALDDFAEETKTTRACSLMTVLSAAVAEHAHDLELLLVQRIAARCTTPPPDSP